MRYFLLPILLVVPLLLTAQSKKEQIATLNLRVDSLSDVLVNERITNEQTLSDQVKEMYQLSQEKSDLATEVVRLLQEKSKIEEEKFETESERDSLIYKLSALSDTIHKKNVLLSISHQETDSLLVLNEMMSAILAAESIVVAKELPETIPVVTGSWEDIVKEGYFDLCEETTVEVLVQNFFANPSWDSFFADDDYYYINVTGNIMYNNAEAFTLVQFSVYEDQTWEINAFEIDGQPQDDYMVIELINLMCQESGN